MSTTPRERDTQLNLLLGGLLTVVFGTGAMLLAVGLGWVAAALLGAALIVLGWRARGAISSPMLAYLLIGIGIVSLLGGGFDLLT